MGYDIEYKQGDIDTAGAVISDDEGVIDLTEKTVNFVMKDIETETHRYEISCTLGGKVNGIYYSPARGGVTIPFTEIETAETGLFNGEFVIIGSSSTIRVPSGNKYLSIMIWDKI